MVNTERGYLEVELAAEEAEWDGEGQEVDAEAHGFVD